MNGRLALAGPNSAQKARCAARERTAQTNCLPADIFKRQCRSLMDRPGHQIDLPNGQRAGGKTKRARGKRAQHFGRRSSKPEAGRLGAVLFQFSSRAKRKPCKRARPEIGAPLGSGPMIHSLRGFARRRAQKINCIDWASAAAAAAAEWPSGRRIEILGTRSNARDVPGAREEPARRGQSQVMAACGLLA